MSQGTRIPVWFSATRPFSFPAAVMLILVVTAAAVPPREWKPVVLSATIALVVAIHCVANVLNDYFDFISGADTRTEDDEGRPGRFLVKGIMRPSQYVKMAAIAGFFILPLAAYLVIHAGSAVIAVILGGIGIGYAYTGPPFPLKRHGLGEVAIFAAFGPGISIGALYLQTGQFIGLPILYGIATGLLVGAIVAANGLRDLEEDAESGARTLAVLIGRRRYKWVFFVVLLAPQALIIALTTIGYGPMGTLLTLLTLPLAFPLIMDAWRGVRKPDADARTAKYMTAFSVLLLLGLLL